MATSLHQQLKELYVPDRSAQEFDLGPYRIDAIDAKNRLIEVQCAQLASINAKVRTLVNNYDVIVVKPLAAVRRITTLDQPGGNIVRSRLSPARQTIAHLFLELVHFSIFPHRRLRLDVLLVEQEELRIPPTARSSWKKKFSVEDRSLVAVRQTFQLKSAADLWKALDLTLPPEFTTTDLANVSGMPLWLAQKACWCLRRMNFLKACGKQGNSVVYKRVRARSMRAA